MALHGLVKRFGEEPEEVFWSHPDEPPALTGPHRAAELSSAEWSDPEKDAKVGQYEDLIRALEHRN